MYPKLLILHSFTRWLVLASLLLVIYRSYRGMKQHKVFSATDNSIRHWTATIAHVQLLIGIVLYTQSPAIKYFWQSPKEGIQNREAIFFGLIHMLLMLTAVIIITIGSALAKRKDEDLEKFRTLFAWCSIGLFIIFIAIPWPFSPLANRVYLRTF